jgi:hypothetical protein
VISKVGRDPVGGVERVWYEEIKIVFRSFSSAACGTLAGVEVAGDGSGLAAAGADFD